MEYIDFSDELWKHIEEQVLSATKNTPGPHYAAFDADGTLWDTDMGENFFDYEIKNCPLKGLPADPWQYYNDTKLIDTPKAYLWLAQINAGHPLEEVRAWSKECLSKIDVPVFPAQKKLIQFLQENSVTVYIVTASIKWAVEPAAGLLGLSYDQVFGIETEVQDGVLTEVQKGLITWREGKREKILEATGGKAPILASGNTMGDYWLLDCASHVRIAVTASGHDKHLKETELELQKEALMKGWHTHSFI